MKIVFQSSNYLTAHKSYKKTTAKKEETNSEKMTPLALQNQRFIRSYQERNQQPQTTKLSEIVDYANFGKKLLDPDFKKSAGGSSPLEYQRMLFMKQERDYYKRMLKQCRSKEEVRKLKNKKMTEFMMEIRSVERTGMDKDTKESALEFIRQRIEGINEEHKEFTDKTEYQMLPEKTKESEKKRRIQELLQQGRQDALIVNQAKTKDVVKEAKADIAQRRENGEFGATMPSSEKATSQPFEPLKTAQTGTDTAGASSEMEKMPQPEKPVFDLKA